MVLWVVGWAEGSKYYAEKKSCHTNVGCLYLRMPRKFRHLVPGTLSLTFLLCNKPKSESQIVKIQIDGIFIVCLQKSNFRCHVRTSCNAEKSKNIKQYKQGISLLNAVHSKRKFPKSFKLRPVLM